MMLVYIIYNFWVLSFCKLLFGGGLVYIINNNFLMCNNTQFIKRILITRKDSVSHNLIFLIMSVSSSATDYNVTVLQMVLL